MKKIGKLLIYCLMAVWTYAIWLPTSLLLTVITVIITIPMSATFGNKKWGFYPARVWSRLVTWLALVPVKVKRNDSVNRNKSYVFVANHQSLFDVWLVYGWLPNKFKWVMKKEVERMPMIGIACKYAGHIFLDRSHPRAALQSIAEAKKKLQDGSSIVMFPEGTRTRDGKIGKFKRGAFQLACDLEIPIVPVTIRGAFDVLPKGNWVIYPHRMEMVLHEPISTAGYTHENIHELIDKTANVIEKDL